MEKRGRRRSVRRCADGSGQGGALLLSLEVVAGDHEPRLYGWPLEVGKGEEMDYSYSLQKGMQPSGHLEFSPVRPVLDFKLPEVR